MLECAGVPVIRTKIMVYVIACALVGFRGTSNVVDPQYAQDPAAPGTGIEIPARWRARHKVH